MNFCLQVVSALQLLISAIFRLTILKMIGMILLQVKLIMLVISWQITGIFIYSIFAVIVFKIFGGKTEDQKFIEYLSSLIEKRISPKRDISYRGFEAQMDSDFDNITLYPYTPSPLYYSARSSRSTSPIYFSAPSSRLSSPLPVTSIRLGSLSPPPLPTPPPEEPRRSSRNRQQTQFLGHLINPKFKTYIN